MKPDTKSTSASSYRTLPSTVDEVLINGVRVPFQTFAFDQAEIVGFDRVTRQKGFFLQDKWTITPRLTLNIGARTDNQQSIDYYGDVIYDKWTLNPRFGFAYSLNREGRDVIRGSWGRYSDILVLRAVQGSLCGVSL
jgi:outer membrane receptor protein involved in Fe transport